MPTLEEIDAELARRNVAVEEPTLPDIDAELQRRHIFSEGSEFMRLAGEMYVPPTTPPKPQPPREITIGPAPPAGILQTLKEKTAREVAELVPLVGGWIGGEKLRQAKKDAEFLRRTQANPDRRNPMREQSERGAALRRLWALDEENMRREHQHTFLAGIVEGVMRLPRWGVNIATRLLPIGLAGDAYEDYRRRRLGELGWTEEGPTLTEQQRPLEAGVKAVAGTAGGALIEVYGGKWAGKVAGKALGPVVKHIPGIRAIGPKLKELLGELSARGAKKSVLSSLAGTADQALKRMEFDGLPKEVAEEWIERFYRATFNLDDMNLSPEDNTLANRYVRSIPGWREQAQEILVLSVPAAGRAALFGLANAASRSRGDINEARGMPRDAPMPPELRTEAQREAALAAAKAQEAPSTAPVPPAIAPEPAPERPEMPVAAKEAAPTRKAPALAVKAPPGPKQSVRQSQLNSKGEFYVYRGGDERAGTPTGHGIYLTPSLELAWSYGRQEGPSGFVARIKVNKEKLIDTRGIRPDPTENDWRTFWKQYGIESSAGFHVDKSNRLTYGEDADDLFALADDAGYDGFIAYEADTPTVLLTPAASKRLLGKAAKAEDVLPYSDAASAWADEDIPPEPPPTPAVETAVTPGIHPETLKLAQERQAAREAAKPAPFAKKPAEIAPAAAEVPKAKEAWQMTLDEWRPIDAFKPTSEVESGYGPSFDISDFTRQFQREVEGIADARVFQEGDSLVVQFAKHISTSNARETLAELQSRIEGRDWDPHREAVQSALDSGRRVSAEVMRDYADYPEMVKKWKTLQAKTTAKPAPEAPPVPKFASEEGAEAARARLKAKGEKGIGKRRGKFRRKGEAGGLEVFDAQDLKDITEIGVYHFIKGARTLETWTREMVREVGKPIREWAQDIWESIQETAQAYVAAEAARGKPTLGPKQLIKGEPEPRTIKESEALKARMKGEVLAAKAAFETGKEAGVFEVTHEPWPGAKKVIESGIVRAGEGQEIAITPKLLLRFAMQQQAKGATKGYRAGQLDLAASHEELLDFAKENLPEGEYKLVVRAAERIVKQRTPGEREKVIQTVNRMAENYERAASFSEFKDAVKEAKASKLRPEAQAKLDALLDVIATRKPMDKTIDAADRLLAAVERDDIGEIPQAAIEHAKDALADAMKTKAREFSPEHLRALAQVLNTWQRDSEHKNQLLASREAEKMDKRIKDAAGEVTTRLGAKYEQKAGADVEAARQSLAGQVARVEPKSLMEMAEDLGGRLGETGKILFGSLLHGENKAHEVQNKDLDAVRALMKKEGVDAATLRKLSAAAAAPTTKWKKTIGRIFGKAFAEKIRIELPSALATDTGERVPQISLTAAELMNFYRNWMDPSTRAALLQDKGDGFVLGRSEKERPIRIKAADARNILNALTPQMKRIADGLLEIKNARRDAYVNPERLRQTGQELGHDALHWQRHRYHAFWEKDPNTLRKYWVRALLEHWGHFKARTGGTDPIVIEDIFSDFMQDLSHEAAYVGKSQPTKDALQLLGDDRFKQAVRSGLKHGGTWLRIMEEAVRDYEGVQPGDRLSAYERTMGWLKRKGTQGVLLLKLHIPLYQLFGYSQAAVEMPGILDPRILNPVGKEGIREQMLKDVATVRHRAEGGHYAILDASSGELEVEKFYTRYDPPSVQPLRPLHAIDIDTFRAIYEKAIEEGKQKGLTGDALKQYVVDRTLDVGARTQATYDAVTSSAFMRRGRKQPMIGLLTVFKSQTNKIGQQVRMGYDAAKRGDPGGKAQFGRAIGAMILDAAGTTGVRIGTAAAWSGIAALLYYAVKGERPPEQKKKLGRSGWHKAITGAIAQVLQNFGIVGDMAAEVVQYVDLVLGKETYGEWVAPRDNLVISAAWDVVRGGSGLLLAASSAMQGEKYKAGERKGEAKALVQAGRALRQIARGTALFGIPYSGIEQAVKPFVDVFRREKPKVFIPNPPKESGTSRQRKPVSRERIKVFPRKRLAG